VSWAVAAASLIFVAWAKMETVQITYQIDDLVDEEERLSREQRKLRSELAALRAPSRLEALAPGLGLQPPTPGQVVIVTEDPAALASVLEPAAVEPAAVDDIAQTIDSEQETPVRSGIAPESLRPTKDPP
jgi:cell division protein FtsL